MTNLESAFIEIKEKTEELARTICANHGYSTPYEILFKNFKDDPEHDQDRIIITPGNPPTIIIVHEFVLWCLVYHKDIIYRHNLASALEHMHVMHRTLRHPISMANAKALRKENKDWVKTSIPNIQTKIAERHLEISYSVTVRDKVSNTDITLYGDNPTELREKAILRLSKQVFENEDLEELHEALNEILRTKQLKIQPAQIVIHGTNMEQVNAGLRY